MPDLRWSRVDAPGGGLQAYYRGKWRLEVMRYDGGSGFFSMGCLWMWMLQENAGGEWVPRASGDVQRQREAKHMARCALEMHVGEA